MGPAFKLLLPRHGDSRRGVVLGRVCLLRCHCVCFDCSIMRQQGQLSQKGRAVQCFVSFFFSYAFLINDGSLPVTVWCDALLLTTPRRWAAWCARPDLWLESPGRLYRRDSSWLCDRDPQGFGPQVESLVSVGWCIRWGTGREGRATGTQITSPSCHWTFGWVTHGHWK